MGAIIIYRLISWYQWSIDQNELMIENDAQGLKWNENRQTVEISKYFTNAPNQTSLPFTPTHRITQNALRIIRTTIRRFHQQHREPNIKQIIYSHSCPSRGALFHQSLRGIRRWDFDFYPGRCPHIETSHAAFNFSLNYRTHLSPLSFYLEGGDTSGSSSNGSGRFRRSASNRHQYGQQMMQQHTLSHSRQTAPPPRVSAPPPSYSLQAPPTDSLSSLYGSTTGQSLQTSPMSMRDRGPKGTSPTNSSVVRNAAHRSAMRGGSPRSQRSGGGGGFRGHARDIMVAQRAPVYPPTGGQPKYGRFDTTARQNVSAPSRMSDMGGGSRAHGARSRRSSNSYANGSSQNTGNVITDRSSTRISAPPGGHSSISFY